MTNSINWRGSGHTTPLLVSAAASGAAYLLATHILKAQGDLRRFGAPAAVGLALGYLSGLTRHRKPRSKNPYERITEATVRIGNWSRKIQAIDETFTDQEQRPYLVVWGLPMIVAEEDFQAVLDHCDAKLKQHGLQSLSLCHESVIGCGVSSGKHYSVIWETKTVHTEVRPKPVVKPQVEAFVLKLGEESVEVTTCGEEGDIVAVDSRFVSVDQKVLADLAKRCAFKGRVRSIGHNSQGQLVITYCDDRGQLGEKTFANGSVKLLVVQDK